MRDQLLQRGPFERHGEAAAQVEQVQLQAVGVGNHGQAGQGAFAGFGLEDGVHGVCVKHKETLIENTQTTNKCIN